MSLSSSARDEDANSDFDRFEAFLTKSDESLYIQNKVSAESTMNDINLLFGPFKKEEIDFYSEALSENGKIYHLNIILQMREAFSYFQMMKFIRSVVF